MSRSHVLRRVFLFASLVLGAASSGLAETGQPSAPQTADKNRIVVMISVDGLAAFYFDDPKAEMPTIRELARNGVRASGMKASTPSVTWPNHTTLVTGDHPARHGVVGNNYFDRVKRERITVITDPVFDKDEIVKVPTIYDLAKAQGLTTASVRWPATRNAKTLDWTTPDVATLALLKKYTTPALKKECEAAGISLENGVTPKNENDAEREGKDVVYTKIFKLILEKHRPNLALLHIARVDHDQHQHGPRSPEAYAAIKESDDLIRQVWDILKRDFPGTATLIIVSDHGFSAIRNEIRPNVVLRQAGLIEGTKKESLSGSVRVIPQGGSALIYVLDDSKRTAIIEQVKKAFRDVDGIERVVGPEQLKEFGVANPKDDPHGPDVLLFAKDGCVFGDTAAGELPFVEKPERRGSHGHNPNLPNLHATFVAWGAGLKSGVELGEIENIDVAPTIARLLHVNMPDTDGKPLHDALTER